LPNPPVPPEPPPIASGGGWSLIPDRHIECLLGMNSYLVDTEYATKPAGELCLTGVTHPRRLFCGSGRLCKDRNYERQEKIEVQMRKKTR